MLKKIIASIFLTLISFSIARAQAPSNIVGKKVTVVGSVTELVLPINNHFHFTSMVNQVGRYNVGLSNEDWSLERYNYRKTGEQTANLTIINYDGEQARLLLFFDSPTSGSVSGSSYNASNELLWSTLDATWTVEDLDLAAIPDTELPSDPSGYYAPASLTGGTLNVQDKYWPVYDETISFATDASLSVSVTNGDDDPTGSGSYSYSKTGTNSATLSYSIDGAGYSFEYALQFTAENTGIYSKFADYGGGSTDITTGPFFINGVAIPEQFSGSPSIKVAPLALSAFRDKVCLQGQNGPVEIDGASEINFDLQLIGQPTVSAATMTVDSVTYDLASFQAPSAFRTNYGYSSFDDELFDVESSSESDWNPYINGKTFNFNITVDGITYSYAHNLPAESSLPSTPNTSFAESLGWKTDSDGYEYQEARVGNSVTLTWDTFSLASSDDFITVSVEELVGDNEIEVMVSTSLPVTATSYEFPSSLFESGKKYILYVAFHKVLESENPTGFEHQTGTNTSQPLLITTARAVTAVDVVIVDTTPVTVVSDPNGQAVVVQVGEKYNWNSSLGGVTLWGVEQSSDGWTATTMRFENGRNFGSEGFYDSIAQPQPYDVLFEVDENGYIKSLEDDGNYQYYNPVSVEDGVIGTIQNDEGVDSVANNGINQVDQWFFTTRSAAEEYYYSKVNPKDWMWFDHYPWVYSEEEGDWLYFYPSGGTLMYWSNKGQAWRQFN